MSEFILGTIIGGVIGIIGVIIGSVVGILLNWRKEYLQKEDEKENKQFENLYGPVIYELFNLKVPS
jgi:ABC-type lipoprotein release transport system permease subunit